MKAKFTQGSGTITLILKRDMGFKFGPMALSLKDFGSKIKPKGSADSFLLTVTFTKVNGLVTKRTEKVNIFTRKAPLIKGAGMKISKKVTEKKSGQMVHSTKETTNLARKMDLENFCGLTGLLMKETSSTIIFMDTENTNGLTVVNSQVTGSAIRCTVPDSLHGLMVGATKVNIMMIKSKDMVSLRGLTAGNMMAHG